MVCVLINDSWYLVSLFLSFFFLFSIKKKQFLNISVYVMFCFVFFILTIIRAGCGAYWIEWSQSFDKFVPDCVVCVVWFLTNMWRNGRSGKQQQCIQLHQIVKLKIISSKVIFRYLNIIARHQIRLVDKYI